MSLPLKPLVSPPGACSLFCSFDARKLARPSFIRMKQQLKGDSVMSLMEALAFGVLMLLFLSIGRSSSARPAVVAANPAATRGGADPLTGLLICILLVLVLLEVLLRGG